MTKAYDEIIASAADVLANTLRGAAAAGRERDVYVWAIHTTAESNGGLYVGFEAPAEIPMGRLEIVRPRNAERWASVPYSSMRAHLAAACMSVPILPLETRAPAFVDVSWEHQAGRPSIKASNPIRCF